LQRLDELPVAKNCAINEFRCIELIFNIDSKHVFHTAPRTACGVNHCLMYMPYTVLYKNEKRSYMHNIRAHLLTETQ